MRLSRGTDPRIDQNQGLIFGDLRIANKEARRQRVSGIYGKDHADHVIIETDNRPRVVSPHMK
jgi:hypothetical protein